MYKTYVKGNYFYFQKGTQDAQPFHKSSILIHKVSATAYTIVHNNRPLEPLNIEFSNIQDENGDAYASQVFFEDFYENNTGFNVGGSTSLPTGWASYIDTQYTNLSPFTLLANTDTKVPNNAGTKVETQKPIHVTTYWDEVTQKITGRNGDGLDIMLYWVGIPSAQNAELDVWIDIGGAVGELYRQTFLFRGTNQKGILYSLPSAYTLNTWEANGGDIYMRSSVNMDMYGFTFNFDTSHKAR